MKSNSSRKQFHRRQKWNLKTDWSQVLRPVIFDVSRLMQNYSEWIEIMLYTFTLFLSHFLLFLLLFLSILLTIHAAIFVALTLTPASCPF